MKKTLTICLLALTLIFTFQYLTKPVEALQPRCPKNSFFPCREEVLQMINKAIAPLQALINSLTTRTDDLEKKVADLEERVKGLEQIAHCPNGMVPEIRFEGDTSPLKCKPAYNYPQPTTTPQPTPSPDSFQVDCDGSVEGETLTVNATANKPIKSCQYTIEHSDGLLENINVTPNESSCSFTENVCGRTVSLRLESFDNEVKYCSSYPSAVPEPSTGTCNP